MADKLIVKAVDACVVGGKAIMLCTEDGKMLGQQVSCVVENSVNERPTVTVTLYIDGERVRFAD